MMLRVEDTYLKINRDRLLGLFRELVSIDSLSFQEREMADRVKRELRSLGLKAMEDDAGEKIGGNAGNVYAFFPQQDAADPGADTVLFVAHMDTVAPGKGKKAVVHEDGRITSDGTTVLGADDLAALSCILEAVRELQEEQRPHRNVELLFPVAEEAYTAGSSVFDFTKLRAKEGYALDCSDRIGSYSSQEPTLISFAFTMIGRAAHAGFEPEKGIDSIRMASEAIRRLPKARPDDHSTFNVGEIRGGTQTNIVPERTIVKGELRSSVHEDAQKLYEEAERVFTQEAQKAGGRLEAEKRILLTAHRIAENDPALIRYHAVLDLLGIPHAVRKSFGGSDNNVLRRSGIDGICLASPMHAIHTTEEYTSIDELIRCTAIIKELMAYGR